MKTRWVALGLAAAGLLVASGAFDAADARRGGGHGGGSHARAGGGGSGHAMGMRSMSRPSTTMGYAGPRSVGPRAMGIRPGGSNRVYTGPVPFRGGVARVYGGHRHAHRHHRHRNRYVGVPLGLYAGYGAYNYYNYYNYYGSSGCEWLRQQALYSGNIYWWDRYYACSGRYDY